MRNTLLISTALFMGLSTASSFAAGVAKETGVKGTDTKAAMPTCAAGAKPSVDGKYYLPGTRKECKPIKADNTGKTGTETKKKTK